MLRRGIGSIVVVPADRAEVVGIVTETDLEPRDVRVSTTVPAASAAQVVDRWVQTPADLLAAYADLAERPLAEVMSAPVHTTEARTSVWEAAQLMLEHGIGHLPVLRDGSLVGVLSSRDLLKLLVPSRGSS
jgi:CBS domain-containing protein